MPGYIVISAFALAAVGVLLMTYVQTGIIKAKGIRHFGERRIVDVYWRDRTTTERWCFFGGLSLLLLPFVAFGLLLSLSHVAVS
jgi:hypothetical protein